MRCGKHSLVLAVGTLLVLASWLGVHRSLDAQQPTPTATPSDRPTRPPAQLVNDAGEAVDGLYLARTPFTGVSFVSNAPNCPPPSLRREGFLGVLVTWPEPCVLPGDSVGVLYPTDAGGYDPPGGFVWLTDGVPTPLPTPSAILLNDTLQAANRLRLETNGRPFILTNGPGCSQPEVIFGAGTADVRWPEACVEPGDSVALLVVAYGGYYGGPRLGSHAWMRDDVVLEPASSPQAELAAEALTDWQAAGSLVQARARATATVLPDGRVLLTGGYAEAAGAHIAPTASAEIYDPATGLWTSTGSMSTPRTNHTATLLPDGTVLVVGGSDSNFSARDLASAEIYNPTTGTWRATGPMQSGRARPTAVLLATGSILVMGGDGGGPPQDRHEPTAELYNPMTDVWTLTGSAGSFPYAVVLPDGNVFAVEKASLGGAELRARVFDLNAS